MKFVIQTQINKNYLDVFKAFDIELFKALKLPLMPLNVIQFDGCQKGDLVKLEVGPLKQAWTSKIIDNFESPHDIGFIDIGTTLPFPFKKWHHCHRIIKLDEKTCIISDEIEYQSLNFFLDLILYFPMYFQFLTRNPQYKRYFNKK